MALARVSLAPAVLRKYSIGAALTLNASGTRYRVIGA